MKEIKEDFYNSALTQIVQLKTTKPELKEILDFYEALLRLQQQVLLSFHPDLAKLDIKAAQQRNAKGFPFLKPEDIKLDQDLFSKLLEDVGQIIRSKSKQALPASWKAFSLDKQCGVLVHGIMENSSALKKLSVQMQIDFNIFYFLISQAFSPFLESYAQKSRESIDLNGWLQGNCPICANEPLMARLEEKTGKRWLFCSLCHSEWLFKRLPCIFCGNDDSESLRYFYVEEDQGYRVDVCDKCKRYIKTVDARKKHKASNLFVENLATLALDIVAKKEGFQGETFFGFLSSRSLH